MKQHLLYLTLLLTGFLTGAFVVFRVTGNDPIRRPDVAGASNIAGLNLTEPEMDSLLRGLETQRMEYEAARQTSLPNDLPPTLVFNPLPENYRFPATSGTDRSYYGPAPAVPATVRQEDLAWMGIRQLATLLRNRKITSVELTRYFLGRLHRHDTVLHHVITFTDSLALEQAKKADAEIAAGKYRGLLHGIPFGVKDLFATKGYKTTWGATPFRDQYLDLNASIVEKLERAGAVLCAKLTLGELAWGDVWYGGMTRNPWAPDKGSSGSSAGSASAVASGCLPFAIGTETLGSIISPSTVCGATGLRPTFGRVSRHGAMALSWTMDKVGPICRSAEDCAIVLEAIAGYDHRDPGSIKAPAFRFDAQRNWKKLRIGYVRADFEKPYPFKFNDSLALEKLRALGVELIPVSLPDVPVGSHVLLAEAAAAFDELTRGNGDDLMKKQELWPDNFRKARFIPAVEYIQANRLRTKLIRDMDQLFRKVDLYINPSWQGSSLFITNMTGHPAIAVPNGFSKSGTPTSITFTGRLFDEASLLLVAKAFQEATGFHKKHPAGF